VKVVKILGVVFGALFLLTGIALLAGSAVFGAGQGEFDRQLAEQGLAGPVNGRVTAIDPPVYTVEYTDRTGVARTGSGQVAEGTTPPEQGDDVQVYYSTLDPSQIIILDFPGGNFAGVAGLLRTVAIICLAVGAVILIAGIIGMVTGRRRGAAVAAGAAGSPPGPTQGSAPPPTPAPTTPPGPDIDPTPTRPFTHDPSQPSPQDPTPPTPDPEQNRAGG
jgi:Protein of unknown function (DUF3592)